MTSLWKLSNACVCGSQAIVGSAWRRRTAVVLPHPVCKVFSNKRSSCTIKYQESDEILFVSVNWWVENYCLLNLWQKRGNPVSSVKIATRWRLLCTKFTFSFFPTDLVNTKRTTSPGVHRSAEPTSHFSINASDVALYYVVAPILTLVLQNGSIYRTLVLFYTSYCPYFLDENSCTLVLTFSVEWFYLNRETDSTNK